ncbi:unnamed protein product [Toxocara canis]|uniref:RRM domain-containing protein n=1 Tax=Toxocara canis TaxID=6265 RepID=A0A183USC8_TOXCA|nr:unnamed protein product [Toxocara canis]
MIRYNSEGEVASITGIITHIDSDQRKARFWTVDLAEEIVIVGQPEEISKFEVGTWISVPADEIRKRSIENFFLAEEPVPTKVVTVKGRNGSFQRIKLKVCLAFPPSEWAESNGYTLLAYSDRIGVVGNFASQKLVEINGPIERDICYEAEIASHGVVIVTRGLQMVVKREYLSRFGVVKTARLALALVYGARVRSFANESKESIGYEEGNAAKQEEPSPEKSVFSEQDTSRDPIPVVVASANAQGMDEDKQSMMVGIIVKCEEHCTLVFGKQHGLIMVSQNAELSLALGEWVSYECIPAEEPVLNGVKYLAVSCHAADNRPRVSKVTDGIVQSIVEFGSDNHSGFLWRVKSVYKDGIPVPCSAVSSERDSELSFNSAVEVTQWQPEQRSAPYEPSSPSTSSRCDEESTTSNDVRQQRTLVRKGNDHHLQAVLLSDIDVGTWIKTKITDVWDDNEYLRYRYVTVAPIVQIADKLPLRCQDGIVKVQIHLESGGKEVIDNGHHYLSKNSEVGSVLLHGDKMSLDVQQKRFLTWATFVQQSESFPWMVLHQEFLIEIDEQGTPINQQPIARRRYNIEEVMDDDEIEMKVSGDEPSSCEPIASVSRMIRLSSEEQVSSKRGQPEIALYPEQCKQLFDRLEVRMWPVRAMNKIFYDCRIRKFLLEIGYERELDIVLNWLCSEHSNKRRSSM